MSDLLLGWSGFIGSNLNNQLKRSVTKTTFVNSENIYTIKNRRFDDVYCCCVPGVKYYANSHPAEDTDNIYNILDVLSTIHCKNFYLVSSQDCNASLTSTVDDNQSPPTIYGRNRRFFEDSITELFERSYILRIGCLFGDNLKKNIIYDLLNNNYLDHLTEDYTMQLYWLGHLYADLRQLSKTDTHISNCFSEPVYISQIIDVFNKNGFNYKFNLEKNESKSYRNPDYKYSADTELQYLNEFIRKYDENRSKLTNS